MRYKRFEDLPVWNAAIDLDSDLKGERFVNEKTRRVDEITRQRKEFLAELDEIKNSHGATNN